MALQLIVTPPSDAMIDSIRGAVTTTMLNDFVSLRSATPFLVTRTVTTFVEGPSLMAGVQVNMPLAGSIVAPEGAPGSKLKLKIPGGTLVSVAETATANGTPAHAV